MKRVSVLIKPASSLCNIRCKYCFYADVSSLRKVNSYGKMSSETTEKMIKNIFRDLADGDELTIGFQGGEPTLAGLTYFQHLVDCVKRQTKNITIHYAIQTNGIIINKKWCQFLKENNFLVGLSLDGTPVLHDINRLDPRGRGTFHKVLQTKKLFDEFDIDYNILCVLTEELSQNAKKVFEFLVTEKIRYAQFIPCLDDMNSLEKSNFSLTPKGFSTFYLQLLPLWLKELQNGNYISIKLFDDIFNLLVRKEVNSCGLIGNCSIQYVIEGDGSVFPCDFYALDEYRLGNIKNTGLKELFFNKISKKFLYSRPISSLPIKCSSCPFLSICGGGCKRMKNSMYIDNYSNYCGYQTVLSDFIPKINKIVEYTQNINESYCQQE